MLGGLSLLVYAIFPNDLVFRNYARETNVLRTKLRKGVSMSLNRRAVFSGQQQRQRRLAAIVGDRDIGSAIVAVQAVAQIERLARGLRDPQRAR
jgi:hypothetical protein